MDPRLFRPEPMNLLPEFRGAREPRGLSPHQPRKPMSTEPILCRIEDGVAVVTLNNPPLNVVTLELTRRLEADARPPGRRSRGARAGPDRGRRAGVLRRLRHQGVSELSASGQVVDRKMRKENETYSKVDDFPKPTIAAVAGLAFGGGLELAVCCDLLVVEENARLALPEIKLGVFPGSGGTVRVTRRIGEGRAKEMMFFGDPIDARDRARLGPGQPRRAAGRGAAHRLPHGGRAGASGRTRRCRSASARSTSRST